MSSGAAIRTAYVIQTDINIIPAIGWKTLPNITNGLNNQTTLTDSEMLNGTRVKSAGMATGGEIVGDIDAELMYATYDDFIAAAFWNDWTVKAGAVPSKLTIGNTRKFMAISKDFTDINAFYAFKGLHVNSMKIDISTDNLIKITFGLMGLGYETSKTISFAKTPAAAVTSKKASGLSIGEIKADGAAIGVCVEAFSFELDNQAEIQKCLGSNFYGGNIFAMIANCSGSMTLAFSGKAYDILELQRTGALMSFEIPIMFSATDGYLITLPKLQISGDIPSPSGNEVVTAEVSYTVVDESPIITRLAAA